ncbi:x-pro dipeptidyl-peptidase c-terminal non-catalytic domain-containing protein [Diplodia corticola]|uniref:X-pro dipeptidyl-peptidase c-terminal non-catalytic domain-containing protein n=1 Tax=Diplodia corticola TaxID=236234 RepID=A0A1J9RNA4_9PEZI|nr:x-pro dipeptidyl-peptidase c-terminal non-catalytic domain-containing protein [Diplodia corticola]OJD34035.1 x-pro dipeptidyl-peptidase c-terminal non-catalytic domain-containing protein [Diplodia corticola]
MSALEKRFPDIVFEPLVAPAQHPVYNYDGFNPSVRTLATGYTKEPGFRAFGVNTIFERDVSVQLRDGVKIYTDIFRPASSDTENAKVPAIIPWSPYGKSGRGPQTYDSMGPYRCGIPKERTSGFHKFEAPDPAEWVERGYAIVNSDARGAGDSEGDIVFWGQQEAEDMYDVVDWVYKQPWCNGSVAFAGNSWLAIAQINFASRLSHPAVKAFAPWEAMTDVYRQQAVRGGVPRVAFAETVILKGFAGNGRVENMPGMYYKRPHYDEYWEDKTVKVENIKGDVPLYLTASYSTGIHSEGSFHTFMKAQTKQKWLRVHGYQEWFDIYRPEVNDELQHFFDRYCKGIENGWEKTPSFRISLLGFTGSPAKTIFERPEAAWPIARAKETRYYLDVSQKTLTSSAPQAEASASYEAHSLTDTLDFTLTFAKHTELAGYPVVKLWMSCAAKSDMDVNVQIRKTGRDGRPLAHLNYPCPVDEADVPDTNVAKFLGPGGMLRASHACTKEYRDGRPFYTSLRSEPVPAGAVVPLEIPVWPIGMVFEEGEGVMLRVAGHDLRLPEVEMLRLKEPVDENVGEHVVHAGGRYDSYLVLPVIE